MYKKIQEFIKLEAAGGIVLFCATIVALLLSNSPIANIYKGFFSSYLTITFNDVGISKPLLLWINDGLMAVFFCLVSLEIKHEVLYGNLNSLKKIKFPIIAAIGGILVPASIFCYFVNHLGATYISGWAIPTATDIAFSLGVLSLFGKRVPIELKILLMAIAIFDDLASILIIAVYYTENISWAMLLCSGLICVFLYRLNNKSKSLGAFVVLGIMLWLFVLKSGVHATIAGVILAVALPMDDKDNSLAMQVIHNLHPWVSYGVMPIFALANAGINLSVISLSSIYHPVSLGIFTGLFIGKPVGIFSIVWIAEKLKLVSKPNNVCWGGVFGVACLCGIGFTMSLFLGTLAFDDLILDIYSLVKTGVFLGSILSGCLGSLCLFLFMRKN